MTATIAHFFEEICSILVLSIRNRLCKMHRPLCGEQAVGHDFRVHALGGGAGLGAADEDGGYGKNDAEGDQRGDPCLFLFHGISFGLVLSGVRDLLREWSGALRCVSASGPPVSFAALPAPGISRGSIQKSGGGHSGRG